MLYIYKWNAYRIFVALRHINVKPQGGEGFGHGVDILTFSGKKKESGTT